MTFSRRATGPARHGQAGALVGGLLAGGLMLWGCLGVDVQPAFAGDTASKGLLATIASASAVAGGQVTANNPVTSTIPQVPDTPADNASAAPVVVEDEHWTIVVDAGVEALKYTQDTQEDSDLYGTSVIGVPVTFTNISDDYRWPYFYPTLFAPDGVEQVEAGYSDGLQADFEDSVYSAHGVEPGATVTAYVYFIDEGPGTYALGTLNGDYTKRVIEFDAPDATGEALATADVMPFVASDHVTIVEFDDMLYLIDSDPAKLRYFYDETPVYLEVLDADDPPMLVREGTQVIGVPVLQVSFARTYGYPWSTYADYFGPSGERQFDSVGLQNSVQDSIANVGMLRYGAASQGYLYFVDEGDGAYSVVLRGDLDGEWVEREVSFEVSRE